MTKIREDFCTQKKVWIIVPEMIRREIRISMLIINRVYRFYSFSDFMIQNISSV